MTDFEKIDHEFERDFKTYDNGVRAGIKLGRESMLEEVLEYMRSEEAMKMDNAFAERNDCMMDRCLWVIALESKFKGNEASETKVGNE